MHKHTRFLIISFCSALVVGQACAGGEVPVVQGDGREEVIENELQKATDWAQRAAQEQTQEEFLNKEAEMEAHFDKTTGHTTYMDTRVSNDLVGDDSAAKESFEKHQKSPHLFELGTEIYYYKYTEVIGVKVDGPKGGLVGAYQYRFADSETIQSWDDFLHMSRLANYVRLEGRGSYGEVDYEGSGTWDGIPDWNFETRGLFGLEMVIQDSVTLKPFSGIGYRYLYNDFSKYPASLVGSTQYLSGYDRESNYVYIPLGLEAKTKLNSQWSLALKGEFDWFIWGKQISHLEDMVDQNGVNAGIDELENTQEQGLGWRASARLTHEASRFNIFIEPFVRYWNIEDSEVEAITSSGSLICQGNLCAAGLEPDNETWEYGVNFGAEF